MKNLPTHLKDPAQTKHQRLYDTVNSLISFLEEKYMQTKDPNEWGDKSPCCNAQWFVSKSTLKGTRVICNNCGREKFPKSDEPKVTKYDREECRKCGLQRGTIGSTGTMCQRGGLHEFKEEPPHWESDYAAIWERYFASHYREDINDVRQDILELIRELMKV